MWPRFGLLDEVFTKLFYLRIKTSTTTAKATTRRVPDATNESDLDEFTQDRTLQNYHFFNYTDEIDEQ